MNRLSLFACALALCACGSDLASPFSAVAVTYDVNKQAFKLAQVQVTTLTSLRHLEGKVTTITAGGTVHVSTAAATDKSATVDGLRTAFTVAQPAQVNLAWNVLNDIVYPEDFDSLELLSTYYNLEKARNLIQSWDDALSLPAKPLVAHAVMTDENGNPPLYDGELYYAPMATFFAPAATPQQAVPSALNLGAVAHALGHEAVEELVWNGAPTPPAEQLPAGAAGNTARHLSRSLAEGIGDYLGVAVSENPHWFDNSLTREPQARALDQIHCGSADMLAALSASDDNQTQYDPYPLGSVIAGALWEEASASTAQNTHLGVLQALPALAAKASAAQGALTLAMILDTLAQTSPDDQRNDLCGLFLNRFAALGVQASDLPSCAKPTARTECQ